jgi:hypothetical protein
MVITRCQLTSQAVPRQEGRQAGNQMKRKCKRPVLHRGFDARARRTTPGAGMVPKPTILKTRLLRFAQHNVFEESVDFFIEITVGGFDNDDIRGVHDTAAEAFKVGAG